MRQHYAVHVWSVELGLYGRCDVVEATKTTAVPVEHKIGGYYPGGPADIQVAAQVLCLREMLDLDVPHGVVFTHADRRRHTVQINTSLIVRVTAMIAAIRADFSAANLPTAPADARCRRCSLIDDCLPHALARRQDDLFNARSLGAWDA